MREKGGCVRHELRILALAALCSLLPALARAAPTEADIAAGRKIAFTKTLGNCIACHVIPGGTQPGNIGPNLTHIRALLPHRKDAYAIIFNEPARKPQTPMPPFGRNHILTPAQIRQVIAFLYSHK